MTLIVSRRGSVKALSDEHEKYIERLYAGVQSPSSGAAITDAGDVRVKASGLLIECKLTGTPGVLPKSKPKIVKEFEKIAQEAWAEGRDPVLCLRYYDPESPLANRKGWIDLSVKLTTDDANGTQGT